MEQDPNRSSNSRETVLTASLAILVVIIGLFFGYLVTLGLLLNVLGVGLVVVFFGCAHYVFWGRSFSREVAREREALRRQEARTEVPPPHVAPGAIQDITRTQSIKRQI
jgi:Flp pilus assembly protein TadB